MDKIEEWKNSSNEKYEISSMGRLRNKVTGNILKLCKNQKGYLRYTSKSLILSNMFLDLKRRNINEKINYSEHRN